MELFEYQGHSVSVFCPSRYVCTVYLHGDSDAAEKISGFLGDAPCRLVNISGINWNKDMSPWPAPRAFRGGEDFSGSADAYLVRLKEIVEESERRFGTENNRRFIAGYSLAGLFAVYSLYRTELFDGAVSASGSMWYEGFTDFMQNEEPVKKPELMYFSLGDREALAKNPRLAAVGACTEKAVEIMRLKGAETFFELNPGNHFFETEKRTAKGIRFITERVKGKDKTI